MSDGTKIYTYLVADKQVIVSPAPGPGEATTPALFLAGRANMARDFTPASRRCPAAAAGPRHVEARAAKPTPITSGSAVGVDPATLQIRHLVAIGPAGRALGVHVQQPEGKPGICR